MLVQSVAPDYPPAALAAGKTADVAVRIAIDADGLVTEVAVLAPVGDGFDEAAVAAARQYVFDPAEFDGVPGPIQVETVIHFVIEAVPDQPPPPPPPDGDAPPDPAAVGPPSHGGDYRQPIALEGQVVERGTRSVVSGAIVAIAELGLDAVTDADGRFAFHGVAPGPYTVLVVADKFDRLERAVAIAVDERVEVRLWLRPRGGSIYATVIEGERDNLEVTRRTIQRQQLTSVPGTFGDPVRVIQTLPGVARTPFGLGFLLIRGSNPDDSAVYIDGHKVPLLFHFLGGPSVLNPEMLEEIELYPGGYPARFGRSHGGVVALETRAAASDGVHGSADVDLLDAGGYVRAPLSKKWAVAIAGRRSYLDFFLGLVLPEPDPGATQVVVPVYWDTTVRADWDGGADGKVALFGIVSSDTLKVVQAEAGAERSLQLDSSIRFGRLIARYQRPLGEDWTLTLSPAVGRDSVYFATGQTDAPGPFTGAEVVAYTFTHRIRAKGPLGRGLLLDVGADFDARVTTYEAVLPDDLNIRGGDDIDIDPTPISRAVETLGVAVHADLAWEVTDRLRLLPGLRVDSYVIQAQPMVTVDPRLTARYQLDDAWLLKGYAGVFHQPPQPEAVDARFGNPEVRSERGLHFGVGGEWRPNRLWLVDGEVYYIDRSELVHFTNDATLDGGGVVTPQRVINSGVSNTYGLEALIKRELSDTVFGWLSYTFSHSVQRRFPTSDTVPTAFDQAHNLNAVVSWKPGGGWELGGRLRLSTGRPETPYVGATYDADSGGYRPVSGGFRATRSQVFQQVDVRAEKTWLFKLWSLGVYVDVQNLFNATNVEATQWDYRYNQSAPVSGVPILPTLGVRGQW
ncbi:MAG: TonB-dependent receptor [Myxococcales bacterium]|nr:TonB-dependent receptor [Myxococcales bacterium]